MYEPYETREQTSGLHRGFDKAKPAQAEYCAAQVLPQRRIRDAGLRNESARTWRQPGTGNVKTFHSDDDDFLAGKPAVFKWVYYIGFGLAMSGVLPMAACAFMFWLFDLLNCWWVVFPLFFGSLWLLVSQVCK